jgi:hypothetical protein
VIGLKQDTLGTATQTPVAIPLAQFFELLGREVARTCVLRGPPLAAVVGLELPDLLGVLPAPLFATRYDVFAIALVVFAFESGHSSSIGLCPGFLVLGYLFLVLFLILPASLDSVLQIGPRALVLSVLPPTVATVLPNATLDARLALTHPPV